MRIVSAGVMPVNYEDGIDSFHFLMSAHAAAGSLARGSPARVDRLRVRHLKLLELIASTGSLTAAAATLQVSQPAASKMLQDLESAFGHPLVDRTTRGGILSLAGDRALERLRIATGALDAIGVAFAVNAEAPLVRIGMLPLAGVSLVPRLVEAMSARGELPRLQLLEGPVSVVLSMLRQGRIDCVIGRADNGGESDRAHPLDIVPLSDEHFELACASANPLARKRRVELSSLRDCAWIVPHRGTYTRQVFEAAFVSMGIAPPTIAIDSASFHISLATVARSQMVTIAPRSAVDSYAQRGTVRKLRLAQPFQPDYAVFITLRNGRKTHALERIQATLLELCSRDGPA